MGYALTCDRCHAEITHRCNVDLIETAVRLFSWRPEAGFPAQMMCKNPYLPDKESKVDIRDKAVPFMSEVFLYPLLGKEDARTLMALVDHLIAGVGLDPGKIQQMAWKKLDTEKQEREAAEERNRKYIERKRSKA